MKKHAINCDCFECADPYIAKLNRKYSKADYVQPTGRTDSFDESQYLNKFIRSNKPVNIYKNPGESPYTTRQPGQYIGKSVSFNSKKNWLKLSDGNWIPFDANYTFRTPDPAVDKLSTDEQINIATSVIASSNPNLPPASVQKAIIKTGMGVADAADSALNVFSFLTSNLKWILLGILLIYLISLFLKIKR